MRACLTLPGTLDRRRGEAKEGSAMASISDHDDSGSVRFVSLESHKPISWGLAGFAGHGMGIFRVSCLCDFKAM